MNVSNMDALLAQMRSSAALAAGKPASPVREGADAGASRTGVDFPALFRQSLDQVNQAQGHAAGLARDFELGAPGANLTEAMISMQKASLSFQYTLQVRNKLVAAYQEIMNMPL
ncbi:flagellar hook-basal body complex protein FliE [Nitrosovibrio sp. Nv17]|uniref:flagellar hook-basal body complex protein FliE n=1 Tax=Nitrosovibrio sp. Nv17 TaxID=1855339 RepID=UPI000908782E|nr:flagellar hook-basal body complex protein FliE [Nitrosovibrio sp. Nv17]SFW14502.1 flagellar hook-basal body complex protein FliE [Nitrosovibrio sp. Nv17]